MSYYLHDVLPDALSVIITCRADYLFACMLSDLTRRHATAGRDENDTGPCPAVMLAFYLAENLSPFVNLPVMHPWTDAQLYVTFRMNVCWVFRAAK